MIRVMLPTHLRRLAKCAEEVEFDLQGQVTLKDLLDEVERTYPMLKGTIREYGTLQRRPFLRFFAVCEDISLCDINQVLPPEILSGTEPFLIVGAIAGG